MQIQLSIQTPIHRQQLPGNDIESRKAMDKKSISRWQSLTHALRGLHVVFKEPNAQIHSVLALAAIALGFYFQISNTEWMAVCFAIASVIGAEAMNTAVEKTVDLASPDWHETAGQAKDAAAAAVLITSIGAAAVGALIFLPKFF
jgi:diacylglycerol kinase